MIKITKEMAQNLRILCQHACEDINAQGSGTYSSYIKGAVFQKFDAETARRAELAIEWIGDLLVLNEE